MFYSTKLASFALPLDHLLSTYLRQNKLRIEAPGLCRYEWIRTPACMWGPASIRSFMVHIVAHSDADIVHPVSMQPHQQLRYWGIFVQGVQKVWRIFRHNTSLGGWVQRQIYGFWCPGQDFQTVPFWVTDRRRQLSPLPPSFFSAPPSLGAPGPGSCPNRLPLDPPMLGVPIVSELPQLICENLTLLASSS